MIPPSIIGTREPVLPAIHPLAIFDRMKVPVSAPAGSLVGKTPI
jgi:hypothetical protein